MHPLVPVNYLQKQPVLWRVSSWHGIIMRSTSKTHPEQINRDGQSHQHGTQGRWWMALHNWKSCIEALNLKTSVIPVLMSECHYRNYTQKVWLITKHHKLECEKYKFNKNSLILLNIVVLKPDYSCKSRSIPWLPVPWSLLSPSQQQPQYSVCKK